MKRRSCVPARFGLEIRGASLIMHTNVIARYAMRTKTKAQHQSTKGENECELGMMYSVQRSTRDMARTIPEQTPASPNKLLSCDAQRGAGTGAPFPRLSQLNTTSFQILRKRQTTPSVRAPVSTRAQATEAR